MFRLVSPSPPSPHLPYTSLPPSLFQHVYLHIEQESGVTCYFQVQTGSNTHLNCVQIKPGLFRQLTDQRKQGQMYTSIKRHDVNLNELSNMGFISRILSWFYGPVSQICPGQNHSLCTKQNSQSVSLNKENF